MRSTDEKRKPRQSARAEKIHGTLERACSQRRLRAAYQRRHNSRVQLIIRRQIRSGISGVSGGGCEIRTAVKAERAARTGAYVCLLPGHVTSG